MCHHILCSGFDGFSWLYVLLALAWCIFLRNWVAWLCLAHFQQLRTRGIRGTLSLSQINVGINTSSWHLRLYNWSVKHLWEAQHGFDTILRKWVRLKSLTKASAKGKECTKPLQQHITPISNLCGNLTRVNWSLWSCCSCTFIILMKMLCGVYSESAIFSWLDMCIYIFLCSICGFNCTNWTCKWRWLARGSLPKGISMTWC